MARVRGGWEEKVSEKLKTASFISMLPKDLQDIAYTLGAKGKR